MANKKCTEKENGRVWILYGNGMEYIAFNRDRTYLSFGDYTCSRFFAGVPGKPF
jgi:hypothetical protein